MTWTSGYHCAAFSQPTLACHHIPFRLLWWTLSYPSQSVSLLLPRLAVAFSVLFPAVTVIWSTPLTCPLTFVTWEGASKRGFVFSNVAALPHLLVHLTNIFFSGTINLPQSSSLTLTEVQCKLDWKIHLTLSCIRFPRLYSDMLS